MAIEPAKPARSAKSRFEVIDEFDEQKFISKKKKRKPTGPLVKTGRFIVEDVHPDDSDYVPSPGASIVFTEPVIYRKNGMKEEEKTKDVKRERQEPIVAPKITFSAPEYLHKRFTSGRFTIEDWDGVPHGTEKRGCDDGLNHGVTDKKKTITANKKPKKKKKKPLAKEKPKIQSPVPSQVLEVQKMPKISGTTKIYGDELCQHRKRKPIAAVFGCAEVSDSLPEDREQKCAETESAKAPKISIDTPTQNLEEQENAAPPSLERRTSEEVRVPAGPCADTDDQELMPYTPNKNRDPVISKTTVMHDHGIQCCDEAVMNTYFPDDKFPDESDDEYEFSGYDSDDSSMGYDTEGYFADWERTSSTNSSTINVQESELLPPIETVVIKNATAPSVTKGIDRKKKKKVPRNRRKRRSMHFTSDDGYSTDDDTTASASSRGVRRRKVVSRTNFKLQNVDDVLDSGTSSYTTTARIQNRFTKLRVDVNRSVAERTPVARAFIPSQKFSGAGTHTRGTSESSSVESILGEFCGGFRSLSSAPSTPLVRRGPQYEILKSPDSPEPCFVDTRKTHKTHQSSSDDYQISKFSSSCYASRPSKNVKTTMTTNALDVPKIPEPGETTSGGEIDIEINTAVFNRGMKTPTIALRWKQNDSVESSC